MLTQFNLVEISNLEKKIETKTDKNGNIVPYIQCAIRNNRIKLNPEEVIRQLYLQVLIEQYNYPFSYTKCLAYVHIRITIF